MGPAPAGPAATTAASALQVDWSTALDGEPGAIASDQSGTIATVGGRKVVALDDAGHERWSSSVDGASLGAPLLAADVVVVPTGSDDFGGCTALDRETGVRRWSYVEPSVRGVAAGRSGIFVVCLMTNGDTIGLGLESGAVRWRASLAAEVGAVVAVSERTAVAVDAATGTAAFTAHVGTRWFVVGRDLRTGTARGPLILQATGRPSAPVFVAPGTLAVAAGDPAELRLVDVHRWRVVARVPLRAPLGFDSASVPVVARGRLVVGARDGTVNAVDLARRKLDWAARAPAPILGARPVVVGDTLVVTDWTRQMLAFRLGGGAPVQLPATTGWASGIAPAPSGRGVDVAWRSLEGGRIEGWRTEPAAPGPADATPPRIGQIGTNGLSRLSRPGR